MSRCVEVVVPVTEPIEVDIELTSPVSCAGEEDAVLSVTSATGGTGDFTYFLSSDPWNITMETTWTGLAPGQTVSVWAFDSNGCFQQSSNSIAITSPTPISVSLSTSGAGILDATCADIEDGEIHLLGFGGNAPATIEFSVDGMNYGPSPLTVSAGTYTVVAQDVYGCQATLPDSVFVGPPAIEVSATASAETCPGSNDGEASWSAVGGQGAYTYLFNGEPTSATHASDLAPGAYEIEVIDGNNCSETALVIVEAGDVENPDCYGCTLEYAVNYNPSATEEDGSCEFNICCNPLACNFDPEIEWNEGPCVFAEGGYDCDGNCLADDNNNGICDALEQGGCTDSSACNYDATATFDDGTRLFELSGVLHKPFGCNFNPNAVYNNGSCDFLSCAGCTLYFACNFDPALS